MNILAVRFPCNWQNILARLFDHKIRAPMIENEVTNDFNMCTARTKLELACRLVKERLYNVTSDRTLERT
jgi:hypothetical protein